MSFEREKQGRWPAIGLLLLSLLLHAGLLLMPLPGSVPPAPQEPPPAIAVRLFAPPADARPDEATEPEAASPADEVPETVADPVEALASEAEAGGDGEADAATAVHAPRPAPSSSSVALRAQLLDSARSLGIAAEDAKTEASSALEGAALPSLPSQVGWLNQYTGTVKPRVDHQQNVDGSSNTRVVTQSGAVFCIQRRAPSVSEIINPWTSTVLSMASRCGRARPEPLDRSDPRLRQPKG